MYILGLILFPYRKNHFSEKRWWRELAIEYPSKTRYSTTITSAHAVSQPHILHRRRHIVFALFIAICHQGEHGDSILHTNTTIGLRNRHVSESISNCEMPNSVSGERPKNAGSNWTSREACFNDDAQGISCCASYCCALLYQQLTLPGHKGWQSICH